MYGEKWPADSEVVRAALSASAETVRPDEEFVARAARVGRRVSLIATVLGLAMLTAWLAGGRALLQIVPNSPVPQPWTLVLLVTVGLLALTSAARMPRFLGLLWHALAAGVVVVPLLFLDEHIDGSNFGITAVWPFTLSPLAEGLSRPSMASCVVLITLGVAAVQARHGRGRWAQPLAVAAMALALFSLNGYALGAESALRIGSFQNMAFGSAALSLALGYALLDLTLADGPLRPFAGHGESGALMRRLIPASVLGLLAVAAVAGEVINRTGVSYTLVFGIGLTVAMLLVSTLIFRQALTLRRVDARRNSAEQALEVVRDLMETRDQLTRQLDEQSRALQQIIETSPDGFVAMDEEGRVTAWNPAAQELFGWTPDEVMGRPLHQIIVPEFDTWVQRGGDFPDRVESIEAFQARSKDVDSIRKDGTRIKVDLTLWPATEQPSRAYYAFARDVTAKAEAHARETALLLELNEKSRALEQIIETSPDGFVAMDEEGRVTAWNSAAEGIFGWSRGEVLGKPLHQFIVPEFDTWVHQGGDFPDRVESIEAFQARSKDVDSIRKDGTRLRVDLTLWPASEEPSRAYYAFARDVTDKRGSEERLLEANSDLREFAAIAAHDLRNPLVAVRLAAEMLAESTKDGHIDEAGREWIGRIQAATLRGQELISDLLEYSSLSSGPRETTRVDLTRLVEEVADHIAVGTDRKFSVELDPLPVIEGDLPRLRQLFANLLGNAAKYVPPDRPAAVHVTARTGRRMVRIMLTDNGDGISDGDKATIFGAFQRGSANRDTPGTGIGLAICRKVVERHGGTIMVEDAPSGGATFVIELPRWPGAMTIGLGGDVPTSLASGYGL